MALTFDADYYKAQRDDVYTVFLTTDHSFANWPEFAEWHFNNHGWKELVNPNPAFNTADYLDMYPDIRDARINPFEHYLNHGVHEGRAPSKTFPKLGAEFNAETYLDANPDLVAAGITTPEQAYAHFVLHGQFEGRAGAPTVDTGIPGETYRLSPAADTLTGTANNDTFDALTVDATGAAASTLTAFDKLDGGAGVDTLNIYSNGTDNTSLPASATIKNIEIINIYNDGSAFETSAGAGIDASRFEGATSINQNGLAVNITKLAATTTAGFNGITSLTTAPLSVAAADTADTANIALTGLKGDSAGGTINQAGLKVLGQALNSVNVKGSLAQAVTTAGSPAATLALEIVAGLDVETVTVNSEVATVLTVDNEATSTKDVTTVDASASKGGISYDAANTVSTIKTGSGKDTVTVRTVTSNAAGSVVNALVETGAGDDDITVNTTGTGKTTVNAGEGDDTITLTSGINTATRIDGGEGNDTVKIAGSTLTAEQYALYNSAISNVETIQFTGVTDAVVDASKLSQFSTLSFAGNGGDKVIEASSATIVTAGNIEAASTGYVADADSDNIPENFGGNLTVQQTGTGTAKLFADSASLTVKAGTAGVTSTVIGELKALNVTLNNGVNAAGTADTLTEVKIDTSGGGSDALASLASVKLSGNGSATVVGGNSLTTIDASELGGTLAYGANKGNITGGLTFTGHIDVVETITLGAGTDDLTINSTFAKMDTIIGFDAVKETSGATSTTDKIVFGFVPTTLDGTTANQATKVVLSENASTLELAFVEAAAADSGAGVVFFHFGGDTYLFDNDGTAALTDGDLAVKVTGIIDFSDDWGVYAA